MKPFLLAYMSKWQKFCIFPDKEKMHNDPCVYAVYFDNDLVYVGSTNRLSNRFAGHSFRFGYAKVIITPWCEISQDTRITIKARKTKLIGEWAMREIRLIHRLNPVMNTHHRRSK